MLSEPNIVLIGMPGAGKSTVGELVARAKSRVFVDTDLLIQSATGKTLQSIVDHEGYLALRRIEAEVLLKLALRDCVVATGGSAVHSAQAMRHLAAEGVIVFLDVELPVIESRVGEIASRGLAKPPEQTLADLFEERRALYAKYADIQIDCGTSSPNAICATVVETVGCI